ncbi:glycosyltransferase [Anabaena sp. FACHB-1237]|nr:glycosyltransferase [Anabaena sp. FACHB-1237]MBD2138508.1 glycosyltransferase [Anabaena sp. FACHB-1237]
MTEIIFGLSLLSLVIWLFLILFWGQFWRVDERLETIIPQLNTLPSIAIVVPARNEAEVISISLRSLFQQDYPGKFNIILVDDQSTDGTANFAEGVAYALDKTAQLQIITSQTLPSDWTGKLWALEQGIQFANQLTPDYILLTDADIEHHPNNLCRLIAKAEKENLDMVSIMVRLRCESFWEKLLIPAFVFFFQKLYPFRWVNNPQKSTAAAAGGCILIRPTSLNNIGGISSIRHALIDDCTLANRIKSNQGKIWLGLSSLTVSLREYNSLDTIWDMVARTAYTQLNYSPLLLSLSIIGMMIVYVMPILAIIIGLIMLKPGIIIVGLLTSLIMAIAYFPIISFYKCKPIFALSLPVISILYTLMTIDSAMRYWQKRGGAWKGRVYPVDR